MPPHLHKNISNQGANWINQNVKTSKEKDLIKNLAKCNKQ